MDWKEILTLLIPILGLMGWVYSRIEKKADQRHAEVKEEIKGIKCEIKDIKDQLNLLNNRLTRLEGRFDERGYWESREWHRTGTEDKK